MNGARLGFDQVLDGDWAAYRGRLADVMAALGRGDEIVVSTIGVQECQEPFLRTGVRISLRRNQIVASIPEYAMQDPLSEWDYETCEGLTGLGWAAPDDAAGHEWLRTHHTRRWHPRYVDQAAAEIVEVLRRIGNIPHPSFLWDDLAGGGRGAAQADPAQGWSEAQLRTAHDVLDQDHLDLLVDAAVACFTEKVERDHDGDVVIDGDEVRLWINANHEQHHLRVFTRLGTATDEVAAQRVCQLVQHHVPVLKAIVLGGNQIWVHVFLDVDPFVPMHLRANVGGFLYAVKRLRDEHFSNGVAMVPGAPSSLVAPLPEHEPSVLTRAYLVMRQRNGSRPLGHRFAVELFGHDAAAIQVAIEDLAAIDADRWSEELVETLEWMIRRASGQWPSGAPAVGGRRAG